MSHYTVGVIVKANRLQGVEFPLYNHELEDLVKKPLALFDEDREVPEYDRRCPCIGEIAWRAATATAEQTFGTVEHFRETFWTEIKKEIPDAQNRQWQDPDLDELIQDRWLKWLQPRNEFRCAQAEAHPMWDKPNPTCGFYTEEFCPEGAVIGTRFEDGSGCGGTGIYRSTYPRDVWQWLDEKGHPVALTYDDQPAPGPTAVRKVLVEGAKWDWYVIGGRWEGSLYKEDETPDGDLSLNIRQIDDLQKNNPDFYSYALLTPEGHWLERGQMGWFGTASNEMSRADWKVVFQEILARYPEDYIVLVDCHT